MHLQPLLETLTTATSLADTDAALSRIMTNLGCGNFSYNYYPFSLDQTTNKGHVLCTVQSQQWQMHYEKERYQQIDPILNRMRKSQLPLSWKIEDELSEHGKIQKKLFSDALDFGLRGGSAIPIHAPLGEFANLVVQDLSVLRLLQSYHDIEHTLQLVAYHYHARVTHFLALEQRKMLSETLTLREIECLVLTAQHKTAKEIAIILKITPRTVSFHIENAMKKLNAPTKYEAVSKATQCGLLR